MVVTQNINSSVYKQVCSQALKCNKVIKQKNVSCQYPNYINQEHLIKPEILHPSQIQYPVSLCVFKLAIDSNLFLNPINAIFWNLGTSKTKWMMNGIYGMCKIFTVFHTLTSQTMEKKSVCDWYKITKIVLVLFQISTIYTDIYTCIYVCSWKNEDKKRKKIYKGFS